LVLIDLPGIIHIADGASNGDTVALVKDLVMQHISNTRAIIVTAVSCKDDIVNQVGGLPPSTHF
jgi:hypothetical protein